MHALPLCMTLRRAWKLKSESKTWHGVLPESFLPCLFPLVDRVCASEPAMHQKFVDSIYSSDMTLEQQTLRMMDQSSRWASGWARDSSADQYLLPWMRSKCSMMST